MDIMLKGKKPYGDFIFLAFIIVLLITIAVLVFSNLFGLYNKQIFDTSYAFTKAYIIDTDTTIEIKSLKDYDASDMIQFTDTEGKVYLTHSSNVILMNK
jgi:hypothetical protein